MPVSCDDPFRAILSLKNCALSKTFKETLSICFAKLAPTLPSTESSPSMSELFNLACEKAHLACSHRLNAVLMQHIANLRFQVFGMYRFFERRNHNKLLRRPRPCHAGESS